ncbi:MAG: phosphotransferase [Pseudomonadota bacterium]
MSDRAATIAAFLAGTPWENWKHMPLAGDASSRCYHRITDGTDSLVLMDAMPSGARSTAAFVNIANWLNAKGLTAPKILKKSPNEGLLLLEDLGRTDFVDHIRKNPNDVIELYAAATDVLIAMHGSDPPVSLLAMTPSVGGQMLDVTQEWYVGSQRNEALIQAMSAHLASLCESPKDVALRDYHAENLIWRPQQSDLAKVGLLDFQDAFLAPRGYDLVSLLRDVRRDVAADVCTTMTKRFESATGPLPTGAFSCLAVQRNLRILGVFARLARRDGKRRYMQMIPHLWAMIVKDLADPALTDLKQVVETCLPPPEQSAIKNLL